MRARKRERVRTSEPEVPDGQRRRNRSSGGQGSERSQNRPDRAKGGKGKRSKQKRGKRREGGSRQKGPSFWGDPANLPSPQTDVRITDDPAAVARSLGPPPLPGHEMIATHYFTAVYDRAVQTAGALAAAAGLLEPEEIAE